MHPDCFQALMQLFIGFVQKDADVVSKVTCFPGAMRMEGDTLIFTIEALHQWVISMLGAALGHGSPVPAYGAFRSQLYRSTLNQELAKQGVTIVVYGASRGKVDSNEYCVNRKPDVSCQSKTVPLS